MISLRRIFRKMSVRRRAKYRGRKIIRGRLPSEWSKFETRQLIRINRVAAGLPPFSFDGVPRLVNGSFESNTSLYAFGNIPRKSTFGEAVGDLVAFNKLMYKGTMFEGML